MLSNFGIMFFCLVCRTDDAQLAAMASEVESKAFSDSNCLPSEIQLTRSNELNETSKMATNASTAQSDAACNSIIIS